MKLNLGCGSQVIEGDWINVDYAIGAKFVKMPLFRLLNGYLKLFDLEWNKNIYLHDLTKKFPWADSSVDVVHSSHTLEHFTREEGIRFLAECHRVLCKNGVIRILVPDLRSIVTEYVDGRIRADDFIEKLGVLYGNSNSRLKTRLSPFLQFPHKCMYDATRLLSILDEIGFDVVIKDPFESEIGDIQLIELKERAENAVIVEGRKR